MKILHTSDLHLGKRLHQHSLLEDQRLVLSQMVEHIKMEQPDLFVVAGDVFDRSLPPEDAMELFGHWLAEIKRCQRNLPVVIISGNHDSGKRLSWAGSLLHHNQVYLVGNHSVLTEPVTLTTSAGEDVEIWAFPFAWAGDIKQPDGEHITQTGAFESGISQIREHQDLSKIQILVAHCFARGGKHSESERQLLGQATLIDNHVFDGFDYVALGHLHRPQKVTDHVWYSGSPLAYSFSENSEDKGMLKAMITKDHRLVTKIPLSPRFSLSVLEDTYENLLTLSTYDHFVEDYCSIRLTAPCIQRNIIETMRKRFPRLLELRVFQDEQNGVDIETTSSIEGSTLEEDLNRFWVHVTGDSPNEQVIAAFENHRPKGDNQ